MRAATKLMMVNQTRYAISIHAAHAGCDGTTGARSPNGNNFNPRSPCGLRQYCRYICRCCSRFQSTQPMRAATMTDINLNVRDAISIHAAHAGCDSLSQVHSYYDCNFNPRSPCGLRRFASAFWRFLCKFQSTQPMRAATGPFCGEGRQEVFQSTQPMRAATSPMEANDGQ